MVAGTTVRHWRWTNPPTNRPRPARSDGQPSRDSQLDDYTACRPGCSANPPPASRWPAVQLPRENAGRTC